MILLLLSATVLPAYAADVAYEQNLIERVRATYAAIHDPDLGGSDEQMPIKCGTPLLLEIRLAWPNLTAATRLAIGEYIQFERPVLDSAYNTPDGRFRLHFNLTGDSAVNMDDGVNDGVPNYVVHAVDLLVQTIDAEIGTMGFRLPPSDSSGKPGEDPRFDVYFVDFGNAFYGQTMPETVIPGANGSPAHLTSWMELHSDYTKLRGYASRPYDAMAVTIAHEYHHSSQWAYDAFEAEQRGVLTSPWFLELSAVAMEEIVFDNVDDYYGYLRFFYGYPWVSLRAFAGGQSTDGLHAYASAVWGLFLTQRYGPVILREIWDVCGATPGFNTLAAFDSVLQARGSSFRSEWAEFLVWNYFTGERNAPWSYDEASQYPELYGLDTVVYHLPAGGQTTRVSLPRSPDALGATYLRFIPADIDSVSDLELLIEPIDPPRDLQDWMVVTFGRDGLDTANVTVTRDLYDTVRIDAAIVDTVPVPIHVRDWASHEELVVIVSPVPSQVTEGEFGRNLAFRFHADDSVVAGERVTAIKRIYSNPLNAAGDDPRFRVEVSRADPVPVTMHIYTPDGQLVRGGSGAARDLPNVMYKSAGLSTAMMIWDGTNSGGEAVASGVYLALVQIGDKKEVIKVAVINR